MVYTGMYDIISLNKNYPASPRSPIVNMQFSNAIRSLYKGDKTEIIGYVEPFTAHNLSLKRKVVKLSQEYNFDLKSGFEIFDFYAETTKIPTEKVLLGPYGIDIKSDCPYEFQVLYLDRIAYKDTYKDIFFIEDSKSTILRIESPDFRIPVLSLGDMVKNLGEIAPSLSKKPDHLTHSVLSNYVGSDFINRHVAIDGINSSYVKDGSTKSNLLKIKSIFENKTAFIPISHFGIMNYLDGNVKSIENMRLKQALLNSLKTISWNMPSDSNTLKMAVFNYSSDGALNIHKTTDLKNNLLWQHSILNYAVKDKTVSSELVGKVMYSVSKEIDSYLDKRDSNVLSQVLDLNNIDLWAGRVSSYFSAYKPDKNFVLDNAIKTLTYNLSDAVLALHSLKHKSKSSIKEKEHVDHRVRVALYLTKTRSKEEFIERSMQITGWSYKYTERYIDDLERSGFLYRPDNIHYYWYVESKFRYKK